MIFAKREEDWEERCEVVVLLESSSTEPVSRLENHSQREKEKQQLTKAMRCSVGILY